VLHCPFCGASETDRFVLEGRRFLVFGCMFTPEVDPALSDAEIEGRFDEQFRGKGADYFRATCDRLHVYVTKGEGARALGAGESAP
jgi:hypothetical protein